MRGFWILVVVWAAMVAPSGAKTLTIATDIAPVQALVSEVSLGVQSPLQIIPTSASPHDYALKPSDARAVLGADLVFWLGPDASPGLAKLMSGKDDNHARIDLSAFPGVTILSLRQAGLFEGQTKTIITDPHMWLAPQNARIWVDGIADALSKADPDNAAAYRLNADELNDRIDEVEASIRLALSPYLDRGFIQFHDAFQYFETAFGLTSLGAATAEDEEETSLGVVTDLREVLLSHPGACVFVLDQSQKRRAEPLFESTGARPGHLDALGREIADLTYRALLESVGRGFADCLSGQD